MKPPMVPHGATNAAGLLDWLRQFASAISTGWVVEHKSNGKHDWHWTTPTFSALRYGGALTWTVESSDRLTERYGVLGNALLWQVRIATSTTGGTAGVQLLMRLPDNLRIATCTGAVSYAVDNGTAVAGGPVERVSATEVALYRYDAGLWSNASTNNLAVYFQVFAELE
jgi:hypothetical protein